MGSLYRYDSIQRWSIENVATCSRPRESDPGNHLGKRRGDLRTAPTYRRASTLTSFHGVVAYNGCRSRTTV